MISNQVIQTSIDELKVITKIDLCVIDMEGLTVAATFDSKDISQGAGTEFYRFPRGQPDHRRVSHAENS